MHSLMPRQLNTFLRMRAPSLVASYRAIKNPRRSVNEFIKAKTGNIVQHGPFSGMRLIDQSSRGDGDIAPKLLGVYEQELHPVFVKAAKRRYGAIVDVGSAEGYYAVGFARMFPGVPVYAYDNDCVAVALTQRTAELNGVKSQVTLRSFCDPPALGALACAAGPLLVLSDCEGYEMTLFGSASLRSNLRASDLVIECHDRSVPNCTEKLLELIGTTHRVSVIRAGGRDPNAFDFLAELSDWERWMAMNERRSHRMNWLYCEGLTS